MSSFTREATHMSCKNSTSYYTCEWRPHHADSIYRSRDRVVRWEKKGEKSILRRINDIIMDLGFVSTTAVNSGKKKQESEKRITRVAKKKYIQYHNNRDAVFFLLWSCIHISTLFPSRRNTTPTERYKSHLSYYLMYHWNITFGKIIQLCLF